jgi:hypothetical protein
MLICLLILSVALTAVAIVAEANPPKPKLTKVMVEIHEDNDWGEDPPTVVAMPKKPAKPEQKKDPVTRARIAAFEWWLKHRESLESFFSVFGSVLFVHVAAMLFSRMEG